MKAAPQDPANRSRSAALSTVMAVIERAERQLIGAKVSFGHGTDNAFDEAVWLVLWRLGLPLDDLDSVADKILTQEQLAQVATVIDERIASRKPAAYLTQEAWLQGVPFFVDERSIVPRSLIAELLADGSIDAWMSQEPSRVLDLCTGNGSLAVLAAMVWADAAVDAADISGDALEVARINLQRHALEDRITPLVSDGLRDITAAYDLILCNPPYVNSASMQALPAEYRAEPSLALAGGTDGMDFIRVLLADAAQRLAPGGVLVLEIGNERAHFEAAFRELAPVWMETSAGEDQVLLLERAALEGHGHGAES
jgi:ribosomal protein L3 glutamine methyltransferase